MGDPTSRPVALALLRRAEHVLFAILMIIATARTVIAGRYPLFVLVGAAAVAAWYCVGIVMARRGPTRAMAVSWLLVLTAGWIGLSVLSMDFVWVAFALFLLYLQLLPLAIGVPGVMLLTVIAIGAIWGHRGRFDVSTVLGPLIGAAVAIVITVVYRDLRQESEARARLVEELTAAQARLAASERQAGMLAERERMAREIHDTVAQSLSSIILVLRSSRDAVRDAVGESAPVVLGQLDTATAAARGALEDARRLVGALTPAELVGRPLADALGRLVAQDRRLGRDVSFTVDGEPCPLPTPVAVALLRVAQGALANVHTHAGPARIGVTLTFQPDRVSLDIADDGKGFDPEQPPTTPTSGTGVGLNAMRTRLAEVGGSLVVESAPARGTAVSAVIEIGASSP